MERVILHCDCNSYYASVESIGRPELREKPMAVCGDPENRHGVILAKNEPAKKLGIKTAESVYQALKKCPDLILLPPHHDLYHEYCKKINAIYAEYTDQVEAFSVDESWLDVTGSLHLFGSGEEIANTLRRRVWEEIGITISVGVSFNKAFAKMGSDYKKPDATTVITKENFRDILWPLPAGDLLFIGAVAADTLAKSGIRTIGDIARAGKETLVSLLGKAGEQAWVYASGLDESRVLKIGEEEPIKSIGNGMTFRRDLKTAEDIHIGLTLLCDQVGTRLRKQGLYGTTLQVQIKDPEFKVISRQRKLENPTNSTRELLALAEEIVTSAWPKGKPIRLLSVTATNLTADGAAQMSLLTDPEEREKRARLDKAMDAVRAKYGKHAVQFGAALHRDISGEK
ncbi:MAG: DNA polymerase IV [Clostridia bacterium]|nr:DNA polymerase IV [Clostridia bacterium]